ncbi:hypothetical protein U9M48_014011 [Paspalum notatum var. saurae]|uniref:F-box domain-containing protein n=1 Tax=Paspalum notatum var. saurae TaxID=547442 RepID=A0AAQ3T0E1_PASNO
MLYIIFGCLDSHVAVIRAAAVCTRWRRIASTRSTYNAGWNYHDFSTILSHYHVVDPGRGRCRRSGGAAWSSSQPRPPSTLATSLSTSCPVAQAAAAGIGRSSTATAASCSSRLASSGSIRLWRGADSARHAGRSKGSIFWAIEDDGGGTVLSAREGTGALSLFRLPDHVIHGGSQHRSTTFRFIEDGTDNLVRVASLMSNDLIRVFLKQEHGNGGGSEWVPVRSLHLGEATRGLLGYKECFFGLGRNPKIVTAGKGYVVLTPAEETWLFSVELGTMQVEREHSRNWLAGEVYPYELRLPPRVRVCVPRCERGRQDRCYRICQ